MGKLSNLQTYKLMLTFGQIIFRLILVSILSGLVGLEREFKHKPAGLRTNILVGLGSTLVMIVSMQFNDQPATMAAGVITGIGFLGAGLIIQQQRGEVHGLTTAATIWVVSAIGLAVGIGYYSAAFATVIIALIILYFFSSDKLRKVAKLNHDHTNYDESERDYEQRSGL